MRRVLAVLASIGLGLGAVALAAPAHAANTPSTLYGKCDNDTITVYSDSAGTQPVTSVTATNPNFFWSTLTLEFLAPVNCSSTTYDVWDGSFWRDGSGSNGYAAGDTFSASLDPQMVSNVGYRINGDTNKVFVTINYNSSGGGDGDGDDSGSSGASGSAPASEIQQFGLPASGNCEDGATEAMNWSGIGMDGWGISWAQWMNEGAGGAVCTRTVVYDTSTAKWTVN